MRKKYGVVIRFCFAFVRKKTTIGDRLSVPPRWKDVMLYCVRKGEKKGFVGEMSKGMRYRRAKGITNTRRHNARRAAR